jgi:hypothetical protein
MAGGVGGFDCQGRFRSNCPLNEPIQLPHIASHVIGSIRHVPRHCLNLTSPPTVALRLSRPAVGPALCSHLSMPVGCSQCGAATVWDDAVGSDVCTVCGSLADPSQSVLTSSQFGNQNDTAEPSLWDSSASTTLKSLRARNNWNLAGQGKESRDRRNAVRRLGNPSHRILRNPCLQHTLSIFTDSLSHYHRVYTCSLSVFCLVRNGRVH